MSIVDRFLKTIKQTDFSGEIRADFASTINLLVGWLEQLGFWQHNPLLFRRSQPNSQVVSVRFRFWLYGKDLGQKLDKVTSNLGRAATQCHKHRTTGDRTSLSSKYILST